VGITLFLFLLLPSNKVPLSLVRLFAGGPVERIDIVGGTVVDVRVPVSDERVVLETAATLRERAQRVGIEAHTIVEGNRIHFGLLGVPPELAMSRARRMVETHTLELKMADDDSAFMNAVARDADLFDHESWSHYESGREFRDIFLVAPTPEALQKIIAASAPNPGPGRELAIESLQDGSARSYYLHAEPVVDGSNVVDAQVVWDEISNQPQVQVSLDDAGARRFGEVTAANIGRKIAILMDGRVVSAPIIQSAIPGGRIVITLGAGSSPEDLEREAGELAASLATPALAAPIEIAGVAANRPSAGGAMLLARLALALFAGSVFFGLVFFVQRQRSRVRELDPVGIETSG
jgi:preprotein translocase subunit SecD